MTYFSTILPTPGTRTMTSPVIVWRQWFSSSSVMTTTLLICTWAHSKGVRFYAEPSHRLYTFLALAHKVNFLMKPSTTCKLGRAHLLGHRCAYDTGKAGQYASAS